MISCEQHDYVEIACTYRLQIILTLKSGDKATGTAVDTCLNKQRQECIKLATEDGEIKIVVDTLSTMKAIDSNPYFSEICFSSAN